MSLDLMVVMKDRISKDLKNEVHTLLIQGGFEKGRHVYCLVNENINMDVSYSTAADIRWYWHDMDDLLLVMGFMPKSEINLSSRHTHLSHITSYKLAKKVAAHVDGYIYDPQVGELYDCQGKPLKQSRKNRVFKYGSGTSLFMRSVGLVSEVVKGDK